ncbi:MULTISPECIES: c-type cytochrome [Shewanella]|uniref:c-type cytochrome n=1 Tax=Shewanella TaxID=22 RepID=UPI0018DFFFE1|nr:c-type cytochrome [Shewanella marisflavi]
MNRNLLSQTLSGLLLIALGNSVQAGELPDKQAELKLAAPSPDAEYLKMRALSTIPQGAFGDKVRLGYQLFVNTQQLRGKYVGNELNCVNCHMDAGRKANASPLWAAYLAYPAYRKKNDKVNSYQERIQGCFTYSMNGKAPESGSEPLVALSAYSYWLAMSGLMDKYGVAGAVPELSDEELLKGGKREDFVLPEAIAKATSLDERAKLPGRGFPAIPKPEQAYSPARGEQVYRAHCQSCHGENGEGVAMAGVYSLPPLWGPNSFNWGAGMHRVNTAANFIYENMPLGKSIQLSHQDAWDVAAFVVSHERPQDPRLKEGKVADLAERYHKHQGYYGQSVAEGAVLGTQSYPINPAKQ